MTGLTGPPCADASAAAGEPLQATASIVRGWLLIEQPGAWGEEALVESQLPLAVAKAVKAEADRHRVRVLLLRRQDHRRDTPRASFVCSSRRPEPWIERRPLAAPDDLLTPDLAAVAAGRRPGYGIAWPGPLYLVCTNGRHDPCCARLGRPVVRALRRSRPEATWECTHLGGDRFAGNLLCLPHGLYFGRLGPSEAQEVVDQYESGRIHLPHYRGRAGDPFPVQAAEHFLRGRHQLAGIDDIVPVSWQREAGVVVVTLALPGGEQEAVQVTASPAAEARLLTCTSVRPQRPPEYTVEPPHRPGEPSFTQAGGEPEVH